MLIGIFLGFISSKFILMILLKIMRIGEIANLHFSPEALIQTVVVFAAIYIVIMLMNALYIKRQQLLSLFHATSTSEEKNRKVSKFEIVIGILGLLLIVFGYYLSTQLFGGSFNMMNQMFLMMIVILASVIIGTYFFYKGSIRFVFNLIRKKNNGYLSVNKVLSLSSIMFRMKSNSLLLTVVTTVSALALGLLSLSYIAYYSAEKTAVENVVYDFSIPNEEHVKQFTDKLEANKLPYTETKIDILNVNSNQTDIIKVEGDLSSIGINTNEDFIVPFIIVSDREMKDIDVAKNESIFINNNERMNVFFSYKEGPFTLMGKTKSFDMNLIGIEDMNAIPARITLGSPVAVVDDEIYQALKTDPNPDAFKQFSQSIGINMDHKRDIEAANEIFKSLELGQYAGYESQYEVYTESLGVLGLAMFVVGFLGLTFLITSGCILYFKQMDEGEEEKGSYTILRKLGFTRDDLLKGIKVKQFFNFGIPLVVGLCHSYFAVKSGWFFFGTELWTPMIIVMVLYTLLYSIFGVLSVMYYKKLIKEAL